MGIVIVCLIEAEMIEDATIAWPLIVRAVLERLEKKRGKKFEARCFNVSCLRLCSECENCQGSSRNVPAFHAKPSTEFRQHSPCGYDALHAKPFDQRKLSLIAFRRDRVTAMRDTKSLMEVAIEAKGIAPKDVPIRQLVELLEAAVSALDAVARENGIEPPAMRLVGVRHGSAAYELYADTDDARVVVRELYNATKKRGVGSGPSVRKALARLHSASKVGQIRITSHLGMQEGKKPPRPIYVEPPMITDDVHSEKGAEHYGRVVGLSVKNEQTFVRLRIDDGGTEEYRAQAELEGRVASFFNKTVRVYVVHTLYGDEVGDGVIEAIDEWTNEEFLNVMHSLRDDLTRQGVTVDVDAWLRELDA